MTSEAVHYDLSLPNGVHGTASVLVSGESFSKSLRVRSQAPDAAAATRVIMTRQTGVSQNMVTAWCWADSGMPAKIICSTQDAQSGQTWNQLIWTPERIQQTTHNGPEGDRQRSVTTVHDSSAEDLLLLIAGRIAWPRLRLGQTYSASLLSSLARTPTPEWAKVEFSLAKDRETVVVPGGSFRVYAFRAKWPAGRTVRVDVEADAPNRMVRWQDSAGEKAELSLSPPTPSRQ